jgi:hypothetical protein
MYCDPIFVCTSCLLQIHVYFIRLNLKYLKGLKFISWCFRINHLNFVFSSKLGKLLELLHTHLGFIFPKVFPCLLVIIQSPIF